MKTIDINCDMGEGMGNDEALMPFISSANIACGYHAGDADSIQRTMELCIKHKIAVGAHPSFFDRKNFGRTEMYPDPGAIYQLILEQLELFNIIATKNGAIVHHVKPHGALYNMAAADAAMAEAIALAVYEFDKSLVLYGLAGSYLISAAKQAGLQTASEAFADRTYQPDGKLTSRKVVNAIISNNNDAVKQVLQIVNDRCVSTETGTLFPINADTICIHGDHPNALLIAQSIFNALAENNIGLKAC